MLNQIVLVGRIDSIEVSEKDDGFKFLNLVLRVDRPYKNADGEYEIDYIGCFVSGNISNVTLEYCKKDDIVGIKGRVQNKTCDDATLEVKYLLEVVVEKITVLNSTGK